MMVVSIVTIFLMTLWHYQSWNRLRCNVSPGLRLKISHRFPTGFGGLLFMILSMLFIGLIIVLEARPVYYFMMSDLSNTPVTTSNWIKIAIHFGLVLIINILVFIIPMKIGLKKLSEFEKL